MNRMLRRMLRKPVVMIWIHRRLLYVFGGLVLIGMGWFIARDPSIWASIAPGAYVSGKKVVIDAGHGGDDPGAKSAGGLVEKDLNLAVALNLKKQLSRVGVYCVMARETDRDFFDSEGSYGSKKLHDLLWRTRVANESGADLFLSIHANSFPQSIYRGAQVFYNHRNPESRRLAEAIQHYLVHMIPPNRRRAKPGNFRVLMDTRMPGAMVETGFMSNPEEAVLLSEPQYQERIAGAIFRGIVAYFCKESIPSRPASATSDR